MLAQCSMRGLPILTAKLCSRGGSLFFKENRDGRLDQLMAHVYPSEAHSIVTRHSLDLGAISALLEGSTLYASMEGAPNRSSGGTTSDVAGARGTIDAANSLAILPFTDESSRLRPLCRGA